MLKLVENLKELQELQELIENINTVQYDDKGVGSAEVDIQPLEQQHKSVPEATQSHKHDVEISDNVPDNQIERNNIISHVLKELSQNLENLIKRLKICVQHHRHHHHHRH